MLPIILVAPHAQTTIDEKSIRSRVALSDYEIWKCSDPFTSDLKEFTCAAKKHIAKTHRLVCDFNRAPDVNLAFHEKDFFGRKVFKPHKRYKKKEKESFLKKYWHPFHQDIIQTLRKLDAKADGDPILVIDYHNASGDHPLNQQREYMPSMVLSNLGETNTGKATADHPLVSMPSRHLRFLRRQIEDRLPFPIEINRIYKGGYETHWLAHLRKDLHLRSRVYAVQLEYNLDYIANPLTKKVDRKALHLLQMALNEAFLALYEELKHSHIVHKKFVITPAGFKKNKILT